MGQNAMLYLLATVSLLCLEPVHTTSPINIRHSLVNQLLDGYEATQAPVADALVCHVTSESKRQRKNQRRVQQSGYSRGLTKMCFRKREFCRAFASNRSVKHASA
uniref:Uncharacterized protein n=1 Tax=Magallana gigas TaxID=29159 RepID=K1QSI4_MAGGI